MERKTRKVTRQLNVRFTEQDFNRLAECQKIMGGLTQADTLRQLMLMFLGEIPVFPQQKRIDRARKEKLKRDSKSWG